MAQIYNEQKQLNEDILKMKESEEKEEKIKALTDLQNLE